MFGQTWIAFGTLVCVSLFMMFMQLYSDSIPDYPGECGTLIDFGFKVFPHLLEYSWLADVWVLVSIAIFIFFLFLQDEPFLILRRFMWLLSIIFFLRAIILPVTRYPGLPINTNRYRPDNWLAGAILVLVGVHQTATDMLFSGHTANWVLTASMMSRYSNYSWYAVLFWVFNLSGIVSLLFLREHYLSDILTGFVITKLVYLVYHLFFDSKFLQYWVPNVLIIVPSGEPIIVNGKRIKTHDPARNTPFYTRLYLWLQWLDGE